MTKLLGWVGSVIGSSAGWWVGAHIGFTTAMMVAAVGTGAGIYLGRRLADWLVES